MKQQKVMLVILDGWGHGKIPAVSALDQANTPVVDKLYKDYPNAELTTFGELVGLPDGQMGNSEVGHLNIGAGRVVYQELARINKAIAERTLHSNEKLQNSFVALKKSGRALHLMGLLSDGGVHSHIKHLLALIDIARTAGLEKIYVHAFLDGRDVAPKSGYGFVKSLEEKLNEGAGNLVSITGRYYAMDRDNRWERIKLAYDNMVHGKGESSTDLLSTVKEHYDKGETDEFIKPIHISSANNQEIGLLENGDTLICFNFRTDRPRQISKVLTQEDFPAFEMKKLKLEYLTMTSYDSSFKNIEVLFEKANLYNTLGEVLSAQGKTQVRIAETEKYPHVTFFFNGGREEEFKGEKRIVIPSPKVATYDLQPEMSAAELTAAIIEEMQQNQPDFICLNFANTDMVGHTGILEAAVKAAETVDHSLGQILEVGKKLDYEFIIIADHGNADIMTNPDGTPHTAHTTNPVPIFYVGNSGKSIRNGKLGDVSPTILHLMNIEQVEEMDGVNLID